MQLLPSLRFSSHSFAGPAPSSPQTSPVSLLLKKPSLWHPCHTTSHSPCHTTSLYPCHATSVTRSLVWSLCSAHHSRIFTFIYHLFSSRVEDNFLNYLCSSCLAQCLPPRRDSARRRTSSLVCFVVFETALCWPQILGDPLVLASDYRHEGLYSASLLTPNKFLLGMGRKAQLVKPLPHKLEDLDLSLVSGTQK